MPCAHQAAHLLELRRRRRAIDLADHLAAHRALADEAGEVRRDARGGHLGEKRRERNRRSAVRAFDERRDALPHVVVGRRHLEDAAARVRVDVDEAGRDDQPVGVDHARRLARDARRDARDGVAAHRDVAAIPGTRRAVDDAGVADDQVVGGASLSLEGSAGGEQCEEQEACAHPRTIAGRRGSRVRVTRDDSVAHSPRFNAAPRHRERRPAAGP